MTVAEQAQIFIRGLQTRKRSPVKPATLAAYNSYLKNWIIPQVGKLELTALENGEMRKFVAVLADHNLSPATINGIIMTAKSIVSSAIDANGNEIYPRKWNQEFLDCPVLRASNQKTPIISAQGVTEAISKVSSQYGAFFALLGGSGLRISEGLALKGTPSPDSSYWDAQNTKLVIKKALWKNQEQEPKTTAGTREVDLAPELNEYLKTILPQTDGFLFRNSNGDSLRVRTVYDTAEKVGVPGYHSFRRYRITHLENQGVPRGLVMFWAGHSGKDVHDRYVRLDKDIEARKYWAEKAGLGFELPKVGNESWT